MARTTKTPVRKGRVTRSRPTAPKKATKRTTTAGKGRGIARKATGTRRATKKG